jgi:DNA-3-methyladenine glycosylase II
VAGDAVDEATGLEAAAMVARVFQTGRDVAGLEDAGRQDSVLAALLGECRGLRPILLPSPFEALAWAILGQQVNVAFAAKTKRALAERYGSRIATAQGSYLLFPAPEVLAQARAEDLAALQLSRQKARYITEAAREVASGRLDLDAIGRMAPEDAMGVLEELPGVGRWTAEYVLLRGFGHPDAIPAADGGLRAIIGREYGFGRSATEAEVRDLAERWAGWRGYAAFYWWFRLQQQRARTPPG